MAYDENTLAILRNALVNENQLAEKKMFGGLVFMRRGNMLCGAMSGHAMFRVGKLFEERALTFENVSTIHSGTRKMNGFVSVTTEDLDLGITQKLLALAIEFNNSLPEK